MVEAHRVMEAGRALGKMVVTLDPPVPARGADDVRDSWGPSAPGRSRHPFG
ncbi:hypothetical protein ACFC58_28345 [Kitasatospora purpeofusca]|uniref:hypothetical protein n=1 Tax=Kitasatospora purpeofusca TaxID=67352 RepID=UPI0035D84AD2